MCAKEMEAFQEYLENRDPQLKEMIQYISSAQNSHSHEATITEGPVHKDSNLLTVSKEMRQSLETLLCSTCNEVNDCQSQTEEGQTDSGDMGYTVMIPHLVLLLLVYVLSICILYSDWPSALETEEENTTSDGERCSGHFWSHHPWHWREFQHNLLLLCDHQQVEHVAKSLPPHQPRSCIY